MVSSTFWLTLQARADWSMIAAADSPLVPV